MKLRSLLLLISLSTLVASSSCKKKNQEAAVIPDVVTPDEPLIAAPDSVYQGPLIISKGGKYTGNYRSTDSKIPAVIIATSEPVELTGCTIASAGDLIKCAEATNLNIHHNNFYGLTPAAGQQYGRALNIFRPHSLTFENNYVEHTGGLLLDHIDTLTGATITVNIRYNLIRNTDKRRADNTGGDERSAIQFNTVTRVRGEIGWNQFENQPNRSFLLHNINLYNSGGTSTQPFQIHDNYIKGAYPFPLNANYFVGSGLTIDGDSASNTLENMSQFINVFNNQVISTCNAGMNLAAGHDIKFYGNTIISAGKYANGQSSDRFWSGCCLWNAFKVPAAVFINNSIKDNTIGFVCTDRVFPAPVRQDFTVVAGSSLSVKTGDNISLPNPITLDTEVAELAKWTTKLTANNIRVGNVK